MSTTIELPSFSPGSLVRARGRELGGPTRVPRGNLGDATARKEIEHATAFFRVSSDHFESLAKKRADALLADHRRVREAARDVGSYEVNPCLPVDLIGVYILLPDAL